MTLPPPVPGLIVSFSFLWSAEAALGLTEGQKDRPCVILAAYETKRGKQAILVPVTHTPPHNPADAVELPGTIKRSFGFDDAPAWIVCGEWNVTDWPGFDLRHAAGRPTGIYHYGMLPHGLYDSTRRLAQQLDDGEKARRTPRF